MAERGPAGDSPHAGGRWSGHTVVVSDQVLNGVIATFLGIGLAVLLLAALIVATLAISVRSRGHRGLTGWASGLDLEIDRPG